MRVAVISDVHGNLPALEAVLADLGSVDALVGCGDLVGYYPDVAEVVDRLRGAGVQAIRGNHELMATGARPVPPGRAGYYRIDWARRALSPEQLAWLAALPPSLARAWDGLAVDVRHASPWDEGAGRWEQRRVAHDHRACQRRLERLGWDPRTIALLGRERAVAAGG